MPEISVIIPVYNVEQYLARCLDSVCNQTYKDIEIICVNDCSPDGCAKILQEYAAKDDRIKIINHQQNSGLSAARNSGLKIATGEYIYFLDSDDWIAPSTLETALNHFYPNVQMVSFGATLINDGIPENSPFLLQAKQYHTIAHTGIQPANFDIISTTPVTAWNKLFKKDIIDKLKITFPTGLYFEDIEFFYKYILATQQISFVDEYLYNYVQRPNSIMEKSANKTLPHIHDKLIIWHNLYNFYQEHNQTEKYSTLLRSLLDANLSSDYFSCPVSAQEKVLQYATDIATNVDNRILKSKTINLLQQKNYQNIDCLNRFSGAIKLLEKEISQNTGNSKNLERIKALMQKAATKTPTASEK